MKKQPERTSETRSNFITAFFQLMKEKTIEKITISEISAIAGYNRSTFYEYFNDVYDLLTYVEDDLLVYINEMVITQIGKENTDDYFVEMFEKLYSEKAELLKILLANQNYIAFPYKLKQIMIPIFANKLEISPDNEESLFKLDFYLSGIISVFSRWLSSEIPMSAERFALLVKQIVDSVKRSNLFSSL